MATLLEICDSQYFPLNLKIRSQNTRYQYRLAIAQWGEHLGHSPTADDLSDDALTIWMSSLLNQNQPPAINTIRERVGRVLTLWTWLAKRGVVNRFPTLTRPSSPDPLPTALTEEQLRRLFASAKKERGHIGKVPADLWWLTFLAFVWMSAERKSAALSVRVGWLDLHSGTVTIPPEYRKGKRKWGVYKLWEESLPMFDQLVAADTGRELLWPWQRCKESYYISFNRILRDAELPTSRKYKTHALRVSHATWRTVLGGDATKALMHDSPATTRKHYIDPRLMPPDQTRLFMPWATTG